MERKNLVSKKKKKKKKGGGGHKNHPTTAIGTGGGEAFCPTDILGTSGRGKAMEPWREGWLVYSLPADGKKKEVIATGATGCEAHASDTTWGNKISIGPQVGNLAT